MDEVLSVGDAFFPDKCMERMHDFQRRGTTIVVVSHILSSSQPSANGLSGWSTAGS